MTAVLPIALEAAVLLRIAQLRKHGGPTAVDFEQARAFSQTLAEKGDVLMYGSKKKGEAAALFNQLAGALSVMAFVPGGVTFAGYHFEAHI
jgi:hypothetical protein